MIRRDLFTAAALTALLVTPLSAVAALQGGVGGTGELFTVSADPVAPAARSAVTLTPIAGSLNITAATMTVTVNGKSEYSGSAAPVAITMGGAGQTAAIVVSMKTVGGTYTQSLSITPQDVALIAEPISSLPPLYPGKALVPLGGSVRVVAVADLRTKAGSRLDPTALVYTWTVDGVEALGASGIGKRTIIIDSPLQYRSSSVSVTVQSQDGLLASEATLDLSAAEPTVRVYERDPLIGIRFDRALGDSLALSGSEVTLYAAPFSFPTSLGPPTFLWYVAGTVAQIGNMVTLRPTGQGAGTASVSVTATSKGSIDAPAASGSLTVSFGSPSGTSLFGL